MSTISIHGLIGKDIMNRISAHDIIEAVRISKDRQVALDFKLVQFTTKSFMDEFYNEMKKASDSGMQISIINMSTDLEQMYQAVSRTQKSGVTEITMKPYARPKTIADLEKIFASMSI